ncbi:DUF2207 domain-containing protein [Agromyces italicus]|uniref:DUF2207 domain-containing protein n=1 Tax=Agromyces italicus TaxID=279572 RepID=UPI0003B3E441|nr:DUF2207 domain-containing protein [Agromyces italicus]
MLTAVVLLAVVPAGVILVLGIVARVIAAQRVNAPVVQYTPPRGSTVFRDALLVDADRRAPSAALIDLAVKRKVRLIAGAQGTREPIGVELADGAVLTADETALLEALFGPEHTATRLRRFSADRRALAGRLKTLLLNAEHGLARDRLIAERRVSWPGTTLTVLAYLGMLVEALFIVFALIGGELPALVATLIALAATIATIFITPAWWRRFLPAATPVREHLVGLHRYLEVAEADRLRALQSPSGAELRSDATVPPPLAHAGDEASAPLARFHLNERLLPYAVLFGLEREWIAKLELEAETLAHTNRETLGDLVEVTADIALAIDAVGGVVQLTAAVGDLVDGAGSVVDGVGGIFEVFGA